MKVGFIINIFHIATLPYTAHWWYRYYGDGGDGGGGGDGDDIKVCI